MKTLRGLLWLAAGVAAAAPAFASDGQSNSFRDAPASLGQVAEPSEAALGGWLPAAGIPQGVVRYAHAQCIGENSFYVFSGVATGGVLTGQSARYDAGTNAWSPLAATPSPSEGPSGVCYQGKIYVAGGSIAPTLFRIYDIATNTWSTGAAIPRPAIMGHMGALNGRIYLVGGDSDFQPSNGVSVDVNIYDVATNTWLANGVPMPVASVSGGVAQIGDFLYVVGGWGIGSPGANVNQAMRYDMANNTWSTGPTFSSARADLVLAASSTAIYAIGGDGNGGGFFDLSPLVERLDVTGWPAGTWTAGDPLPSARSGHKGGFCTNSFFPASGEIWSTGGIAAPFPTFSNTNQYTQAEVCPSLFTLNPIALSVDATGNRVLEPNEAAVSIAPSWMNAGAAAIPGLTGAASAFTGPAGPTYTLNDAAADYGAAAAGATVSCTATGNCYAATVTSATRPALHWDAQFTETLTPSGETKDWTIHVGASFDDVPPTGPFYRFVELLLHKGVTGGCGTSTYCPGASTTRAQMAVFVLIAKEGLGYTPPACAPPNLFLDVPETSPFCRYIEELANRQIVAGCAPAQYCPNNPVTREQMAIFVLKTLDPAFTPPPCVPPNTFADVPETSPFCRWIEELAGRGIVTGCGGGNYCPSDPVTREQMGVFIALTFALTLYGL